MSLSSWRDFICHFLVSTVFKDNNSSWERFQSGEWGWILIVPLCCFLTCRERLFFWHRTVKGRLIKTPPPKLFRRQQGLVQRHRRPGHHHASDHPKRRKPPRPTPHPPPPPGASFTEPVCFPRSWPVPSSARAVRGSSRSATSAGRPSRSMSH